MCPISTCRQYNNSHFFFFFLLPLYIIFLCELCRIFFHIFFMFFCLHTADAAAAISGESVGKSSSHCTCYYFGTVLRFRSHSFCSFSSSSSADTTHVERNLKGRREKREVLLIYTRNNDTMRQLQVSLCFHPRAPEV
jgi:hypothetical protein